MVSENAYQCAISDERKGGSSSVCRKKSHVDCFALSTADRGQKLVQLVDSRFELRRHENDERLTKSRLSQRSLDATLSVSVIPRIREGLESALMDWSGPVGIANIGTFPISIRPLPGGAALPGQRPHRLGKGAMAIYRAMTTAR